MCVRDRRRADLSPGPAARRRAPPDRDRPGGRGRCPLPRVRPGRLRRDVTRAAHRGGRHPLRLRRLPQAPCPAMSTSAHTTRDALDERWDELRALDASEGTLALIVVRPAEGVRVVLETGELSLEDGLVGDRWRASARSSADGTVNRDNQLTLMSTAMLALIAQPELWPLSGDNLLVDMGLDLDGLPAGTRLAIG